MCTRETLQSTIDSIFTTAFAKSKSGLSLSPSIKISQNNILLKTIEQTAWANITAFYKPFRVSAIDQGICTAATFILATQAGEPALMSVRVKTEDASTTITELEILSALKGSHMFFAPNAFDTAPAMWAAKDGGGLTREKLIEIADLYPSGIQKGDGSAIPQGTTCPRIENGVQTTATCAKGLFMFKQPVRDRRWVADTETGNVLGAFYFDKMAAKGVNYGLFLNEYFKIIGGKMSGIQAVMKEVSLNTNVIRASD